MFTGQCVFKSNENNRFTYIFNSLFFIRSVHITKKVKNKIKTTIHKSNPLRHNPVMSATVAISYKYLQ
jgi:hypothetical protein